MKNPSTPPNSEQIIPICQAADPNPKTPLFIPPPGSCDCHAHIFGHKSVYPFTPNRNYTPPEALLSDYLSMLSTLGIDRAVIVQPSVYGIDNRAMLEAVVQGGDNFKGVVVVNQNITSDELARMHKIGVRGVRCNLLFKGGITHSALKEIAEKIREFHWHIQLLVNISSFSDFDSLHKLPVDLVFDHMGHLPPVKGVNNPGFVRMLKMLESGKAWTKLSAPYRLSSGDHPYQDVLPFVKAILKTNPKRCVWATDWPHPAINGQMVNDGDLLNLLASWIPQEEILKAVLVDNPAALYWFN